MTEKIGILTISRTTAQIANYERRTLFQSLLTSETRSAFGRSSGMGSARMNLLTSPPLTSTPLSATTYRRMPSMNDFSRSRMDVASRCQTPLVQIDRGPVRELGVRRDSRGSVGVGILLSCVFSDGFSIS